ncbi:MAG: MBL fold metallo-hydrolase [Solirubrobacteraceae bacterium]|nr:MBL fold metallo-hydrolase [Solirubrobacteraceae bacterium]
MTPSPRDLAHYLRSIGRFVRGREEREAADRVVVGELEAVSLGLPAGLDIEWLGVAGYRLTYEGQTIYLDPYLSRVPLGQVIGRRAEPALGDPDLYARLLDERAGEVVGILAGHTHFDHAIDIPAIARRYGTKAYGSRSLRHLMGLHGLADSAVEIEPNRPYELGPFTVRFVPSLHSKLILGVAVPSAGELTCEHLDGLTPSAFRCGDVFGLHIEVAGCTIYHQGSANLIDDQVPRGGVDVFLAGIAGRTFTRDYWSRILPRLEPRVVVASHFDDFFRPVEGEQGLSLNVGVRHLPDEVGAVSDEFAVAALRPLETYRG